MSQLKRDFNQSSRTTTVVIGVEKTVSDANKLQNIITILKARFNTRFCLVFKTPELLFFNRGMLNITSKGLLDRAQITDSTENFWFDLIEFSKRQETDEIIISSMESLLTDPAELIKFQVELQHACFSIIKHKNIDLIAIQQTMLRELSFNRANSLHETMAILQGEQASESSQIASNRKPSALFVTKQGMIRFGGLGKFLKSNLTIDGIKPSAYKRVWQIDNDLHFEEYANQDISAINKDTLVTIPGLLYNKSGRQLIVDINPGALSSPAESLTQESVLNAPRILLSIRMAEQTYIAPTNDKQAIFIMSNYNKAPYITGALYSITMQTHKHCSVFIIDDISSDNSLEIIQAFCQLIDQNNFMISYKVSPISKGTYWIRNTIIHQHIDSDNVYFVNDSDDFSCCQRASIQIPLLQEGESPPDICFGDIIRVDKTFTILPLDGKVERYGTASLSAPISIHKKYGYYENIRKNADTEFIERLRYFAGKSATKWFRYPVLFQPFDGSNLTSDIYKQSTDGALVQQLNKRAKHTELFKRRHNSLKVEELTVSYSYPNFSLTEEYYSELTDFLIIEN